MKKVVFLAGALVLSSMPGTAFAQAKAPAKTALSEEQQTHAVQNFAIMASAMRSDKVGDDVKSALMGCIYSNSLSTISDAIDKLIAANPGKVDRAKPDDLLNALVAVCGYKPSAAAAAGQTPPPAGPPAAPPAGAPKGR
jgi:hypothetical protein